MKQNGAPRPPAGLKAAGLALWRDLTAQFEWEPYELHLVRVAAVHLDLWVKAAAGESKRDRGEARAEAVVVARLLRELRIQQATEARPPDLAAKKKWAGVA
jgi:hypothetical protein